MIPKLIAFDLDKTLALSKQAVTPRMSELLVELLSKTNMAITSGGMLTQLTGQVADRLPAEANLSHLYMLPTSGAALAVWNGNAWSYVYQETLSGEEAGRIQAALMEAIVETNVITESTPSYGERIELRGAQVTLSALGQQAPIHEKEAWDPDGKKKMVLRDAVAKRLPEYDVKSGGSTSIDVTRHGINKAYGIRKLSEHLAIPIEEMLYVGDALFPGGNDEVVKETGIPTRQVADPDETEEVIKELLGGPAILEI